MRYFQFVVLAVLVIFTIVGSWNVCKLNTVKDWANCTFYNNVDINESIYYCNGVNISFYEDKIRFRLHEKIIKISCKETLNSTLVLPKLGEAHSCNELILHNCLSTEVPLRDILVRLEVGSIPILTVEGKMDTLASGQLANPTDVITMRLYKLGLRHIDHNVFGDDDSPDSSIKLLNFFLNDISHLDYRVFKKLIHLEQLDLSHNQLTTIPDDLFIHNKALEHLDIGYNKLDSFSSKLLKNQKDLETLYVSFNRLTHLSGEWTGLDSLTYLVLYNNQLTSLGEGEESVLRHLHKLKVLWLNNNELTRLYRDWGRLKSITSIFLSHNNIQTFKVEDFTGVTHDMYIDLEYNNITTLTIDPRPIRVVNDTTKAVVTVDLSHNPLICDCDLHSFVRYTRGDQALSLPRVRFEFIDSPDINGDLVCGNPPMLKNHLIKDLSLEELTCPITEGCPQGCSCYYRPEGGYTVVNCSRAGLERAPQSLPVDNNGETQLILAHNQLVQFTYSADLWPNVTELDLSNTSLTTFTVFNSTGPLKKLDISHNYLRSLSPDTVRHLHSLDSLSLHHNPWSCADNQQLINLIKNPINVTIYNIDQTTCSLQMKMKDH